MCSPVQVATKEHRAASQHGPGGGSSVAGNESERVSVGLQGFIGVNSRLSLDFSGGRVQESHSRPWLWRNGRLYTSVELETGPGQAVECEQTFTKVLEPRVPEMGIS